MTTILKFVRECTSILATQVDSPALALRLFLLAAQIASECGTGFEDLAYDLYVQAFSVYEDSISESRAQLAAITLIIGTLQGARVFEVDGYDTLITKAALHGAKLLKKPHQATAVHAASHLWWQEATEEVDADADAKGKRPEGKEKEEEVKAVRGIFFSVVVRGCSHTQLVPTPGQQTRARVPPKVAAYRAFGDGGHGDGANLL